MMAKFEWPENCKDCTHFHENLEDEAGVWAPFCDLFHGVDIDPRCDKKKIRVSKGERTP